MLHTYVSHVAFLGVLQIPLEWGTTSNWNAVNSYP